MQRSFLVVADSIFPIRTAEFADVFFPAAMWVEKEGIFSNSERRYHLVEKLVEPPGEARSDLDIFLGFADALGYGEMFPNRTPQTIWDEWRVMSRGTKYDFSGMTYERLQREPGIVWPVPTEDHPGTCRRFVPGEDPLARGAGRIDFYARPDGRAIVFLTEQLPFHEAPDDEYPFILTTGRRLEHWHTNTLTGRVAETREIPTEYLEIHPVDARRLGLRDGDPVDVVSRRSTVRLSALPTDRVRPGLVFATFHSMQRMVNATTIDAVDPISCEPEYKLCAVNVLPHGVPPTAPNGESVQPGQLRNPEPPSATIPQEPAQ
jgi:nitrate reductase (cytochrome)